MKLEEVNTRTKEAVDFLVAAGAGAPESRRMPLPLVLAFVVAGGRI
jgi:hypothetical protein